jgi:hypothetical protein
MTAQTRSAPVDMEAVRHRIRMCGIWSWIPCIIIFAIAFGLVAGLIPPTGENWSAERIAEFYADNRNAIRAGLIASMFATALMLPFYGMVSENIRRIEGPGSLLAPVQFGGAVILVAFFQIICLLWLLASFRSDTDPQIVRAATDYGWLVWTILIPTLSLQWICMAIAAFIDPSDNPVWPRWMGYVFIWVSLTNAGGICAVYLKTGPFSWNGLVGWWMPTVSYAIVMTMAMWFMHVHESRLRVAATTNDRQPTADPALSDQEVTFSY